MLPYPPFEEAQPAPKPKWYALPKGEGIVVVKKVSEVPVGKRFYFLDDEKTVFLRVSPSYHNSKWEEEYSFSVVLETGREVYWNIHSLSDIGIAYSPGD